MAQFFPCSGLTSLILLTSLYHINLSLDSYPQRTDGGGAPRQIELISSGVLGPSREKACFKKRVGKGRKTEEVRREVWESLLKLRD